MFVHSFASLAIAAIALLGHSVAANMLCSEPAVRREWRSLDPRERAEWISAVKCLSKLPHDPSLAPTFNTTYTQIPPVNPSSSYLDDFVYTHMDLNPVIHFTGQFLPWHRAYVNDFETALKEKCGYWGTQPYWDWTLDASDFQNSPFFDPDTSTGLGGWGDPKNDYQITDGGFADIVVSYPVPHKIRRNFSMIYPDRPDYALNNMFTPESIDALIHSFEGDFIGLQSHFETASHGAVHRIVGGDLLGSCPSDAPSPCIPGPKWSPNDPLFILHHAMIDKIWYDWQYASPRNFWSFAGGMTAIVKGFIPDADFPNGAPPYAKFSTLLPTDGIMNNYTIYDVMDTRHERLCYIYE